MVTRLPTKPPGGTTMFCRAANGAPKPASIQNPYCLLNRSFEGDLAEVSYREQVPLLAYSVLGMGMLTGKYSTVRCPLARASRNSAKPWADAIVARWRIATEEYAACANMA